VFADGRTRRGEATAAGIPHFRVQLSRKKFTRRGGHFEFVFSFLICAELPATFPVLDDDESFSVKKRRPLADVPRLDELIREVRGQKVILDTDLARIYGIPTFRFNEAIKRNRERFPDDFMFRLTPAEFAALTSQFAITKPRNSSQIAMSLRKHRGASRRERKSYEKGIE